MTILDEIKGAVVFAQGHRTQAIMVVSSIVQTLGVFGVLTHDQVAQIQSVLLPLAGATFAAKISRASAIAQGVVGDPPEVKL